MKAFEQKRLTEKFEVRESYAEADTLKKTYCQSLASHLSFVFLYIQAQKSACFAHLIFSYWASPSEGRR